MYTVQCSTAPRGKYKSLVQVGRMPIDQFGHLDRSSCGLVDKLTAFSQAYRRFSPKDESMYPCLYRRRRSWWVSSLQAVSMHSCSLCMYALSPTYCCGRSVHKTLFLQDPQVPSQRRNLTGIKPRTCTNSVFHSITPVCNCVG